MKRYSKEKPNVQLNNLQMEATWNTLYLEKKNT